VFEALKTKRYVEWFYENEEIRLDKESIKSNAAKRGLTKLCHNSMWGKLTEKCYRKQTKIISEPKDLYGFLAMPGINVTNLAFFSDDVVWNSWNHAAEKHVPICIIRMRSSAPSSPQGLGLVCIAISTGCKRKRSISTEILSYTFIRETSLS